MQFRAIILIALLAPQSAAAFGNLDCIAIESCTLPETAGSCTRITQPFAVTFDWADESAVVTANGIEQILPWASSGDSAGTLTNVIEYGDPAQPNRSLRIEASGTDITAYFTFEAPIVTKWTGICNVRQAA